MILSRIPETPGDNAKTEPLTVEHLKRIRRVFRAQVKRPWTRTFRTRLPMIVLVHDGMLLVRRGGKIQRALKWDVVLLTPGTFELTARPLLTGGDVCIEHAKLPMSALPVQFSAGTSLEQMMLQAKPEPAEGVYLQKNFLPKLSGDLELTAGRMTVLESMINTLLHSYAPAAYSFLRAIYFEKRWAFLSMMELHARHVFPVKYLASRYHPGRAAFFRDCVLYTGHSPASWFHLRRMDLADAWIHAGRKTVSEVASLLHYEGVGPFTAEYRKHFLRAPEEPRLNPERSSDPEDPNCYLRPCWWPSPLPLAGREPRAADESAMECWTFPETPQPVRAEDGQPATEASPDLSNDAASHPKPETLAARFINGEIVPATEIIHFPIKLPELLKAA